MRWSYSASRSFRQCQRQWFFKNIVASARANEPLRRRAYLLSKLQSVSAWRGKVVDDIISKTLVPSLSLSVHHPDGGWLSERLLLPATTNLRLLEQ